MSPWYVKTIKYTFIKNYLSIGFKNLLAISLAAAEVIIPTYLVIKSDMNQFLHIGIY